MKWSLNEKNFKTVICLLAKIQKIQQKVFQKLKKSRRKNLLQSNCRSNDENLTFYAIQFMSPRLWYKKNEEVVVCWQTSIAVQKTELKEKKFCLRIWHEIDRKDFKFRQSWIFCVFYWKIEWNQVFFNVKLPTQAFKNKFYKKNSKHKCNKCPVSETDCFCYHNTFCLQTVFYSLLEADDATKSWFCITAMSDTLKIKWNDISTSRPPFNPKKTQNKEKITVQQNETKIVKKYMFLYKKKKEKTSSLNSYFLYLWKTKLNLSSERKRK